MIYYLYLVIFLQNQIHQILKHDFPNDKERLQHIFANQVYGLAPTEIIYRIAIAYILGFSDEIKIEKHNLRQFDTLPVVQAGNLEQKLDEIEMIH